MELAAVGADGGANSTTEAASDGTSRSSGGARDALQLAVLTDSASSPMMERQRWGVLQVSDESQQRWKLDYDLSYDRWHA